MLSPREMKVYAATIILNNFTSVVVYSYKMSLYVTVLYRVRSRSEGSPLRETPLERFAPNGVEWFTVGAKRSMEGGPGGELALPREM